MSFFRHREIYESDVRRAVRERRQHHSRPHRLDEFPAGLFLGLFSNRARLRFTSQIHFALKLSFRSSVFIEHSASTFKHAVKERVKVAFGTDAGALSLGNTAWDSEIPAQQFRLMVDFGMDPMQAIKSGTSVAAELLGMKNQVGSVSLGTFADIIAAPGDPLKDIQQLKSVDFFIKDGKQVTKQ